MYLDDQNTQRNFTVEFNSTQQTIGFFQPWIEMISYTWFEVPFREFVFVLLSERDAINHSKEIDYDTRERRVGGQ